MNLTYAIFICIVVKMRICISVVVLFELALSLLDHIFHLFADLLPEVCFELIQINSAIIIYVASCDKPINGFVTHILVTSHQICDHASYFLFIQPSVSVLVVGCESLLHLSIEPVFGVFPAVLAHQSLLLRGTASHVQDYRLYYKISLELN